MGRSADPFMVATDEKKYTSILTNERVCTPARPELLVGLDSLSYTHTDWIYVQAALTRVSL